MMDNKDLGRLGVADRATEQAGAATASPPFGSVSTDAEREAAIILQHLTDEQRAFILRMAPNRHSQRMNAADWEAIEPNVDVDDESGLWPFTYWFGGMRLTWPAGRAIRRFQFSEAGLLVRQALAARKAHP